MRRQLVLSLLCAAPLACSPPPPPEESASDEVTTVVPEAPSIMRELRSLEHDGRGQDAHLLGPSLPSHNGEFSPDGRLLATNNCPASTVGQSLCLQVFRPEANPRALVDSSVSQVDAMYSAQFPVAMNATDGGLFSGADYPATLVAAADGSVARSRLAAVKGHLCQGEGAGPYSCVRDGLSDDCYDLTIVLHVEGSREPGVFYLASRPVTVFVKDPKTPRAAIHAVVPGPLTEQRITGQLEAGRVHPLPLPFGSFPEMNFTRDGRLLGGRVDPGGKFQWRRKGGAIATVSDGVLIYGSSAGSCRVDQLGAMSLPPGTQLDRRKIDDAGLARLVDAAGNWADPVLERIKPITAAYDDPALRDGEGHPRYGIAAQPIETSLGAVLGEGAVLPGSYGWIDQRGNNLVFFVGGDALCQNARRCAQGTRYRRYETAIDGTWAATGGPPQGATAVVGMWTQGRIVVLDGPLNVSDYGVSVEADLAGPRVNDLKFLGLYQGVPEVIVNDSFSGSPETSFWRQDPVTLARWVKSAVRFSSIENAFSYYRHMRPKAPRDVVWHISRGRRTDEIVFDDFMDPGVLLLAEMNATVEDRNGRSLDGFRPLSDDSWSFDPGEIRLQNAARSTLVPVMDRVGTLRGPGRVEPVALGGVRGKGLWLGGQTAARFGVRGRVGGRPTYFGGFFDPRPLSEDAGAEQILFKLAKDGPGQALIVTARLGSPATTAIRLYAAEEVRGADGQLVRTAMKRMLAEWKGSAGLRALLSSERKTWVHLGLLASADGREIRVLIDGNDCGGLSLPLDGPALGLEAGAVYWGSEGPPPAPISDGAGPHVFAGFRGWIDEARIVVDPSGTWNRAPMPAPAIELLCNYARGTMLGMSEGEGPEWSRAARFSGELSTAPGQQPWWASVAAAAPGFERYWCWVDYQADHGVNASEPIRPEGTFIPGATLLRPRLLFPEGPLYADAPRPSSQGNGFCQTCHHDLPGRAPTLSRSALQLHADVAAKLDPRRQPMQPPADPSRLLPCVGGRWPRELKWLLLGSGPGFPAASVSVPAGSCQNIDEWTLPRRGRP